MASFPTALAQLKAAAEETFGRKVKSLTIKFKDGSKLNLSLTDDETVTKTPPKTRHSDDFRSVSWYDTQYQFTAKQAAVVQRLWEAWEDETPEVSQAALLEAADSDSDRLRELFRVGKDLHPSWGKMIVQGGRRGTYRLVTP